MTREQIEAGPMLDAEVAVRCFGWEWWEYEEHWPSPKGRLWRARLMRPGWTPRGWSRCWRPAQAGFILSDTPFDFGAAPPYSTDIAAAWALVEKLSPADPLSTGPGFVLHRGPGIIEDKKMELHSARFFHANGPYYDVTAIAPTAELAICRAALLASEARK